MAHFKPDDGETKMGKIADKVSWTPPDPAQVVMDGVEPVSLRERLEWIGAQPLQPTRQQKPLDIGFWNPMRDQIEMF